MPKFLESGEGGYPFILKPNLGFPELLNLRDIPEDLNTSLKFKVLALADRSNTKEQIISYFQSNVFIQPILKEIGPFQQRRGEKYGLKITNIEKIEKVDKHDYKPEELKTKRDCIVLDMHHILLKFKAKIGKRTSIFEIEFALAVEGRAIIALPPFDLVAPRIKST